MEVYFKEEEDASIYVTDLYQRIIDYVTKRNPRSKVYDYLSGLDVIKKSNSYDKGDDNIKKNRLNYTKSMLMAMLVFYGDDQDGYYHAIWTTMLMVVGDRKRRFLFENCNIRMTIENYLKKIFEIFVKYKKNIEDCIQTIQDNWEEEEEEEEEEHDENSVLNNFWMDNVETTNPEFIGKIKYTDYKCEHKCLRRLIKEAMKYDDDSLIAKKSDIYGSYIKDKWLNKCRKQDEDYIEEEEEEEKEEEEEEEEKEMEWTKRKKFLQKIYGIMRNRETLSYEYNIKEYDADLENRLITDFNGSFECMLQQLNE